MTGDAAPVPPDGAGHHLEITYCRQCRWLLRAAWTAQELLTTFERELAAVTLRPGTGGVFEVRLDGALVHSRKAAGGFAEMRVLKQLVRDRVAPDRDLGHSDRGHSDREHSDRP